MNSCIQNLGKKPQIEEQKCCICGMKITGYGNNAYPVKEGICCNGCNITQVIPARMNLVAK